ncbi:inclusion membrane protein A [Legionella gratiana]|uniref:Inclusion membrane protein A n=1 Tax=Legionella gratiana TaxID=45066 RepID=A0A378JAI9_9GAMM|nr:LegC2/C7 family Dot/Icm T4SS effector [Legionella gratiana]KTD11031.1 inclusion membrane protein A [Legionella gratiana]STX44625.1 inclusion membrane protein A [Legionella gratiana]
MSSNEQELQENFKTEPNSPTKNKVLVEKALAQMNFSNAAKQLLLDPNSPTTDLNSLQSIALTQEHLTQVKKSLGAIVDSLQENPSLISRAAKFWGEIPLWQRILGGVAISGPTFLIGAAAHIGFLVTISGVSALAYTTSGIILDDHHYHSKSIAQKLKEGIFGVAEVLELTIGALDSIRKKLAIEVERFKEENNKLANNITQLNEEVETLSMQVETYVKTEELLRKQKTDLENIAIGLRKDIEKQGQLFEANQQELAKVKEWHEKSVLQLSQKASELSEVRKSMSTEIEKAKKIASTLEKTVKFLSNTGINDSSQREEFQKKLDKFLSEKNTSFDEITERMSNAEKELSEVKSELKASNERYKLLLDLQEKLICRLELLDQSVDSSMNPESIPVPNQEQVTTGGLLSVFGFLARPLWSGNTPKTEQKDHEISEDKKPKEDIKETKFAQSL